jgi:hypothetical protein
MSLQNLSKQDTAIRLVPAYALWLLPAALAIISDWSAWLTVACLIPGTVWYSFGEGTRSYRELQQADPNAPTGRYVPALSALALFVVAVLFASRFAGLIIVGGFAYIDAVSIWRRSTRVPASPVRR